MTAGYPRLDDRLRTFRNQYHQQLDIDQLSFPSPDILRSAEIQDQVFHYFFDPDICSLHPPLLYRRQVLKELLGRIEQAVVDPEEDVGEPISMHRALCLLSRFLFLFSI